MCYVNSGYIALFNEYWQSKKKTLVHFLCSFPEYFPLLTRVTHRLEHTWIKVQVNISIVYNSSRKLNNNNQMTNNFSWMANLGRRRDEAVLSKRSNMVLFDAENKYT